jgi:PUA-domain protein
VVVHKSCALLTQLYEQVLKLPKKRHRYFLKAKEAKYLLSEVLETFGAEIEQFLDSKTRVEVNETETAEIFIFNGIPLLARSEGLLFPTLTFEEFFPLMPRLVVDMGAIPYVCKGADVMAPGVVSINGQFKENDVLLITDVRHGKPLAVGVALLSSEAMKTVNRGKTVKNLHYVGDKLWNHLKGL